METYRGFDIYWSTINNAYNAMPRIETRADHPEWPPMAARTLNELKPVIDYLHDGGK